MCADLNRNRFQCQVNNNVPGEGGGSGPSVDKRFLLQRDTTSAFRPRPSPPPPLAEETDRQVWLTSCCDIIITPVFRSSHLLTFDPVAVTDRLPAAETNLQKDKTRTYQVKSRTRVSPGPESVQDQSGSRLRLCVCRPSSVWETGCGLEPGVPRSTVLREFQVWGPCC